MAPQWDGAAILCFASLEQEIPIMSTRTAALGGRAHVRNGKHATSVGASPDVSNLAAMVEDARQAGLDGDPGPGDPTDFHSLTGRLIAARAQFPPVYVDAAVDPFVATLQNLGQQGFTQLLMQDPQHPSTAGTLFDIAQAILQRGEAFEKGATDAFQEVVGDLYDGFLSAEDRKGVAPPENATVAPLIKWGNPADGPYTWPIDATRPFELKCAIVNMPPSHARRATDRLGSLGPRNGWARHHARVCRDGRAALVGRVECIASRRWAELGSARLLVLAHGRDSL